MTKCGFYSIAVLAVSGVVAMAQGGGGPVVRNQAPTDKALDIPAATLTAEFADMAAKKRVTTRMIEGGAYSLNARYLTGTEPAQVHKSIIEFYFIKDGAATLVTGGKIVDKVIQGGVERSVKTGDTIFIPPGVPHGFKNATGISYLNIHFGGTD